MAVSHRQTDQPTRTYPAPIRSVPTDLPGHATLAHISAGASGEIKTELFIGHVQGRSTIGYAETLPAPKISFEIHVTTDSPDIMDRLPEILVHMERNGIGAMRSQGFGQFEVARFGDLGNGKH